MPKRVTVTIEVDALDLRGREPAHCVADMLYGAATWMQTGGVGLRPHRQPLRNVRSGVIPEFVGSILIEEITE